MPKKLESGHKIISLHVLATGQMILTTEQRIYEHKDGKWTPMQFADDPADDPVEPKVEPVQTDPVKPDRIDPYTAPFNPHAPGPTFNEADNV